MNNSFYRRFGRAILLAAVVSLPLLVYGARQAINSNENRVRDWLPPSFDETKRLDWFIERFGREEILVVSWPECTLSDPKLEQLAAAIVSEAPVEDGQRVRLFRRSYDGRQMLRRLTSEPLELSESEALERLEGWLVGPDHRTTCVLALIDPAGAAHRHRSIDWVYECVKSVYGLSRDEVRVAGSSVDSVAIDNVSFKSSRPLSYLCWAICIVIAVVSLQSLRVALLIFVTAVMSQFLSVSLLYVTGTPMSAVLMMVGSLVFVLSISGSVHLVNYYRDAIHEVGLEAAPRAPYTTPGGPVRWPRSPPRSGWSRLR